MSKLARKLDAHQSTVPDWCRGALSLERIEHVGVHGCFWLLFFSHEGRIVHSAGTLPGAAWPLTNLIGRVAYDLPSPSMAEERVAAFKSVIASPEHPVLIIDMWQGGEVWYTCEVECDTQRRCGILAIGFRPCIEQPIPDDIEVRRLKYVTNAGNLVGLSLGELEVLRLLALGMTREEMAHEVHRTVKAIERRRTTLGNKLDLHSSHMLTIKGLRAGLHRLSPDELESFWKLNCDHHRYEATRVERGS